MITLELIKQYRFIKRITEIDKQMIETIQSENINNHIITFDIYITKKVKYNYLTKCYLPKKKPT